MLCWCLHSCNIRKLRATGLYFKVGWFAVHGVFCWSLCLFLLDAYDKAITSMFVRCVYVAGLVLLVGFAGALFLWFGVPLGFLGLFAGIMFCCAFFCGWFLLVISASLYIEGI